jgi:FkbM family methyltransferase
VAAPVDDEAVREFYQQWERQTNAFLLNVRGVVHIGAHAGQERDLYGSRRLPVVWVEALPDVYRHLCDRVAWYPDQRAFNYLLTDEDGKEYDFGVANNGGQSSSIFAFADHRKIWPHVHYTHSLKLQSATFKAMVEREAIDLRGHDALVMDVQGTELLVLRGMGDLLDSFNYIRSEAADFEIYKDCCQLKDLDDYLVPRGFRRVRTWRAAGRQDVGYAYEVLYARADQADSIHRPQRGATAQPAMKPSDGLTRRSSMIPFDTIGDQVERRWRDANYNDDMFPEIVEQVLHDTAPVDHVDPWDIIRWLFTTTHIPAQHDVGGRFGQPPITVYNGPRFCVDVYYWIDGTTSIHQHGFCGAFYVLAGSSIHSQYRFDGREYVNPYFITGELSLRGVELLEPGKMRRILPGEQFIHALFHLDRPSVSICVRTHHSPAGSPQWNYHPPFFAQDPFYHSPDLNRKVQSIGMLLAINHPDADALVTELLNNADFQTTFAVMDRLQTVRNNPIDAKLGRQRGEERYQAWLEVAHKRHGELVVRMQAVFSEAQRQQDIAGRRAQVTKGDHRFFLALLLIVPDRTKVLEFVKQRYPDREPVDQLVDWLDDLAHTQIMGSVEANVLGLGNVDDDYLLIFENLLQGRSLGQTKAAFADEFSSEYLQQHNDNIEQTYATIRASQLFRAVFRASA